MSRASSHVTATGAPRAPACAFTPTAESGVAPRAGRSLTSPGGWSGSCQSRRAPPRATGPTSARSRRRGRPCPAGWWTGSARRPSGTTRPGSRRGVAAVPRAGPDIAVPFATPPTTLLAVPRYCTPLWQRCASGNAAGRLRRVDQYRFRCAQVRRHESGSSHPRPKEEPLNLRRRVGLRALGPSAWARSQWDEWH